MFLFGVFRKVLSFSIISMPRNQSRSACFLSILSDRVSRKALIGKNLKNIISRSYCFSENLNKKLVKRGGGKNKEINE